MNPVYLGMIKTDNARGARGAGGRAMRTARRREAALEFRNGAIISRLGTLGCP